MMMLPRQINACTAPNTVKTVNLVLRVNNMQIYMKNHCRMGHPIRTLRTDDVSLGSKTKKTPEYNAIYSHKG